MAIFYQEPNPTNDPNYLNQSREPSPLKSEGNKSLGALFEGIGTVVKGSAAVAKQGFEESIKRDAHALIDPIQDAHGVNMDPEDVKGIAGTGAKGRVRAAQLKAGGGFFDPVTAGDADASALPFTGTDTTNSFLPPEIASGSSRPLPQGAEQEVSRLNRMTQAYRAGNLSDSYYNAQLVSVTKELRARYPGFRDEVDAAVSGITGIQPANALRRSLLNDIYANQAALMAGQTAENTWRDKNAGKLRAMGLPLDMPIQDAKAAVAGWDAEKLGLERKQLKATVNSDEAESALSDTVGLMVRSSLVASSNQAQGTQSLDAFRKKAQDMTIRGGGTAQEIQQLSSQVRLARGELEQKIRQQVYAPIPGRTDGHNLVSLVKGGDAKVQQILQTQLKPYDDMISLIENKQFSALEASTNMLKEQGNRDLQNLYVAFPQARTAVAINNAFSNNPIMANKFIDSLLPDWQRAIKNGVGNAILGGSETTPAPTPTQSLNAFGPKASKSGAVAKETVAQYDLVISPENKNAPNAAHVAKQFFGDRKFYDNMNDQSRLKLFMTMANPAKTAYIQQLAQQDPEVMAKYQDWSKYAAGDIFRRNSADLQQFITDKSYNIAFNPATMQFEDRTPPNPDPTVTAAKRTNLQYPLQSINNAITILKPIVGNDPDALLAGLGIDPNAPKRDGLIDTMVKGLGEKLKSILPSKEDVSPEGVVRGTGRVSLSEPEGADLRKVVGNAESGGNYNAVFGLGKDQERDLSGFTVAEIMALQKSYTDRGSKSSAVGKYQFLRKTLGDLVKAGVVNEDEKFTPDIQEHLFTALAKRRGLDDYTSGKIDEATFANNLAAEWAGLPTTNGMSFYAGDGLNKANATLPQVLSSLRKLRTSG